MPIIQPSQYDCDNMENGDVVYVKTVNPIYKYIRKWFLKDKVKIRVRHNWSSNLRYDEYYQEDCVLVYAYEVACVQQYKSVPCTISKSINAKASRRLKLDLLQIDLYNVQIVIDKHTTLTLPTLYFQQSIDKNINTLKAYNDTRKIKEAIKFQKYKGDYFKKYVAKNNITLWNAVYCSICGEQVEFNFNSDGVKIVNCCKCGALKFPLTSITYDEFSLWYTNQVVTHPEVAKYYGDFWFKRETG